MKKNFFKSMLALSCAALFALAFTACDNTVDTPDKETDHKLHEDPTKVTVQLIQGHMHMHWPLVDTKGGFHQDPESEAKYLKRFQEITYEVRPGTGWTKVEGSADKFYVVKAHTYTTPTLDEDEQKDELPAPVYMLVIKYFNAKGELMNEQFVNNGQDAIHQHFFTVENQKELMSGNAITGTQKTPDYIEYKYTDTTPWDKTVKYDGAKLTGTTNPIGFKGVMKFLKDDVTMDLRIRLYHGFQGKKDPHTGQFSPYYRFSPAQLQLGTWDINFTVPVVVYAYREDHISDEAFDEEMDVDKVPEDGFKLSNGEPDTVGNKLIRRIMKAFNLSWTEALRDYHSSLFKAAPHDPKKGIWL